MNHNNKSLFTCCRHDKRVTTKQALANAALHDKTRTRRLKDSKKTSKHSKTARVRIKSASPTPSESASEKDIENLSPEEEENQTTTSPDMSKDNTVDTFRVPRARLCILHKWPNYDGYGFSLIGHRGGCSQYINSVEPDSPADKGGLRVADRVIAVNGKNVCNIPHKVAVSYIIEKPDRVELLLLGPEVQRFYQQHNLPIHADSKLIERFETPLDNQEEGAINGRDDD